MLTEGHPNPSAIEASSTRWRARFNGHVIADSAGALIVREGDRPQVVYFPREDVAMEYFGRTDHLTHDPARGDAGYYTLRMDSHIAENVAWTFDRPSKGYEQLAGYIAFFADQVEVYAVDDALVNPHHRLDPSAHGHQRDANQADLDIDEVVRHTDSGSGASQGEHWDPNTTGPVGGLR